MAIKPPPPPWEVLQQVGELVGDSGLKGEVDKGVRAVAQSALSRLDMVSPRPAAGATAAHGRAMEVSVIKSRALTGLSAPPVRVEAHLSNGLPAFNIVGMPETAVRESKDRVRSAIINSHFDFPDRRITINLAPADLKKEGSAFDLREQRLPRRWFESIVFIIAIQHLLPRRRRGCTD